MSAVLQNIVNQPYKHGFVTNIESDVAPKGLNEDTILNFKPTYLYIKQHNITGLKYFGKTISKDPHKYQGSGKRWTNHIRIHGYDVTTTIFGYYTSEKIIKEAALRFSMENNIVKSSEWANLTEENGLRGGSSDMLTETKNKISAWHKGKPKSDVTKTRISATSKGKPKSQEAIANQKISRAKTIAMPGFVNPNFGRPCLQCTRDKIGAANTGRQQSAETRNKRSASLKGVKQSVIECPYCNIVGGIPTMKRWHFENCKAIKEKIL